ncbi:MAG: ATP-binding protein [Chloroflexota bacterium]
MSELRGARILYIEDDTVTARLLKDRLEQAGYQVDIAGNGQQGLEMCRSRNYDVIAVDQNLPARSGLDTIHLIAATPGPFPPTILVTGPGHEDVAVEALKLGASDYIIKDAAGEYVELLMAVVERVLEQQYLVREKQQVEEGVKQTIVQIKQAKQEWESTVDSLSQFVCLLDNQGRIMRANRTVERWKLAPVSEVKHRELHELFHPVCADLNCYLRTDWVRAWRSVSRGQPAEFEAEDPLLGRYFRIQVRPVSLETMWQDEVRTSFAVVVIDDFTERKQAEEERERLIEELDAFAHTVAHDLQNPLGPIIGFAEALEINCEVTPTEQLREYLQVIGRNARKMSNIIDELLLLAGVRKRRVELQPLDMAAIVLEAQQRLVDVIEEYQAKLVTPNIWPTASGYAPWIEEVWVNYISNAIKYGGQPPRVELGATRQIDGMIRFWVRDNGIGLTLDQQNRLFTPFTQLSQVQTEGYGLGLSIVQRIVEKLGGQVGVESAGIPGRGSVFSFTLPAVKG